ncbi:MAG: bifunctional DNA-formamidopyrimidine glycosylase/DNA-(apurinic or apyrimidinic site) lyase [Patescibacteria group bacterium]|nr:bifunctional DNA-formamidopyrimidine glycosylase/DNA-(apurinic or apyrimidinic site) lyase [Patescibacteria group bacterium]
MPELPEVETIRRDLYDKVRGNKITDFRLLNQKTLKGIPEKEFKKGVTREKIVDIERRAKILVLKLTNDKNILLHMKMTGHLLIEPASKEVDDRGNWVTEEGPLKDSYNQYIRAIFYLSGDKICAFSDLRKFGYIKLVDKQELSQIFKDLGPEPFSREFTKEYLAQIFTGKRVAIKKVLMDQKNIAGIGNIYADEILYRAQVHPLTKADNLNEAEIAAIYQATKGILKEAIKLRGTSTSDFRDTEGEKGKYGMKLAVYKKNGQPCPNDGALIERIVVGGRGTHFCPLEQKEKK